MSTAPHRDEAAPAEGSQAHPATTQHSEVASSPAKRTDISRSKTEVPQPPETFYHPFVKQKVDPLAEGSKALELSQRLLGKMGYFWSARQMSEPPIYLPIRRVIYDNAVRDTLRSALQRLIRKTGNIEEIYINQRAEEYSRTLANGVMIATYLKLATVNLADTAYNERFSRRPKVPSPFEVPSPFALAISQLGIVEASSTTSRKIFVPSADADDASRFLLTANQAWETAHYSIAVEYAKSVGMEFTAPDLQVKLGSAWWLHNVRATATVQAICCPLPEDNFTNATAVLFSLFCTGLGANFGAHLFDLDEVGEDNYADFLVNPPPRTNVNSFFAISNDPNNQLWKVED